MAPIVSLLVVLTFSLLITRIATVALALTGLSQESARFQARSAFTGVGFTTSEAEQVVNHPVRRRILMVLMMMGNAGIVTVMASLILGFVHATSRTEALARMLWLLAGLLLLLYVARSRWIERHLNRLIQVALRRWTDLDVRDYANLFQLSDGYAVSEMLVEPTDWMADRTLADLALSDEGVLVLGIHREEGGYVGAPKGKSRILPGDRLIMYGQAGRIADLAARQSGAEGEAAHEKAVDAQEHLLAEQERLEETGE